MLKGLSTIIVILFSFAHVQGQSEEYKPHLKFVLKKSILNKTFTYNTNKDKIKTTSSEITFLGITKNRNKVLHISETYPAAIVRHGYMMLLVIDKEGKEYFYRDVQKPERMNKGILIFKHLGDNKIFYYFKQNLNKELPLFICVDKHDCYNYTLKN